MATVRAVTAYQYVADALRRQVLDGWLGPGQVLPPERELCKQFSASRITVRRALQILADEMLIERRQGIGTFVSPAPSRRIPLLNTDFSGSMAAHAPDLERALETHEWQQANTDVAASLQTFPGAAVFFARRLDLLRDEPVAFDEIHLPESVADLLDEEDLAQLRFLERWQSVQQIRLGHLSQRIEAVAAESEQVRYLGGNVGAPLLKEVDIVFLSTGTPCGQFVSYYRHDLFQLTSTVRLSIASRNEESD
ncbi:MAG: GntR family transcriptional regulator [Pirellulales bacterium]